MPKIKINIYSIKLGLTLQRSHICLSLEHWFNSEIKPDEKQPKGTSDAFVVVRKLENLSLYGSSYTLMDFITIDDTGSSINSVWLLQNQILTNFRKNYEKPSQDMSYPSFIKGSVWFRVKHSNTKPHSKVYNIPMLVHHKYYWTSIKFLENFGDFSIIPLLIFYIFIAFIYFYFLTIIC